MIERLDRLLSGRACAAVLGVMSALVIGWVWGSWRPPAVVADERAYLLQARLFASGHWAAPAAPLPEFFEQMHVLVTPVFASKYPPGHSLLMAPGVWLGLPAAVPVILTGIAGALVFALARRAAGPWAALATWVLWVSAPGNLHFRTGYFSQMTTSAAWLAGWWALLRWRDTGRRRWIVSLAVATAWGAVARPFTMLLYAVPVAVVVLALAKRRRAWSDLALACAAGAVVLAVLPLWNLETLGDWRTMPLSLYNRMYMPNDRLGLGTTYPAPLRALPPDQAAVNVAYEAMRRHYTLAALPRTLALRLLVLGTDMWDGWRAPLIALALLGCFGLSPEGKFAGASATFYVVGNLYYAHRVDWSLYYLEILPVLAFLTAAGLKRLCIPQAESRPSPVWMAAGGAVLLFAVWPSVSLGASLRAYRVSLAAAARQFDALMAGISDPRAIVFVRYAARHDQNRVQIANEADLKSQHVWLVYDRGPDNARLMAAAPDRAPYLLDEERGALIRLTPSRGTR